MQLGYERAGNRTSTACPQTTCYTTTPHRQYITGEKNKETDLSVRIGWAITSYHTLKVSGFFTMVLLWMLSWRVVPKKIFFKDTALLRVIYLISDTTFKTTFYLFIFSPIKAGKCCNWEAKYQVYFRGSKHSLRPYLQLWQERDSYGFIWLWVSKTHLHSTFPRICWLMANKEEKSSQNKIVVVSSNVL